MIVDDESMQYFHHSVHVFKSRDLHFRYSVLNVLCVSAFCELMKEKVRNNPKEEDMVIFKSYTAIPQTEVVGSH